MAIEDAQFFDGLLTVFLYREVLDAGRPKQIAIRTKPRRTAVAAKNLYLKF